MAMPTVDSADLFTTATARGTNMWEPTPFVATQYGTSITIDTSMLCSPPAKPVKPKTFNEILQERINDKR